MTTRTASGQGELFEQSADFLAGKFVAAMESADMEGLKKLIPKTPAARSYWPSAWDKDRAAVIARLLRTEKWTVMEAAFYLRCVPGHITNLIDDGTLTATNTARLPDSRPVWRIYRDKVLAFEKSRIEGAKS
jgi:hypothetical protein